MKKTLLLLSFFFITSCTNEEEPNINDTQDNSNDNSDDVVEAPDPSITDEHPRVIEKIEYVEFIDSHEEAEFLQEEDFIDPEYINFEILVDNAAEDGISSKQLVLRIEVEEDEELIIGSTHFRLEYHNGKRWEQIEDVNYGVEDAQAIITSEEPFERNFGDIDQFDNEFGNGIYRFVNSGYAFPFSIYVLE